MTNQPNKPTNQKPTLTTYNIKENKGIKSIDLRFKLISVMCKFGWEVDRFGHLKIEGENHFYRFKLSTNSMRYEYRNKAPRSKWYNKRGGGCVYYKQMNVYSNGKFEVVKPKAKKKKPITSPQKTDSGCQMIVDGKGYILEDIKTLDEKVFTEKEFKETLYLFMKERIPEKEFKSIVEDLEKGTIINFDGRLTLKMITKSNDLLFHGILRKTLLTKWV